MYIKRLMGNDTSSKNMITIEKFDKTFLMIDLKIIYENSNYKSSPYYWGLNYCKNNPPLEICINKDTGQIVSITTFISDFEIINKQLYCDKTINENTIFETKFISNKKFYYENNGEYHYGFNIDNKAVYFLFNKEVPCLNIIQNDSLSYYFNKSNELIGFNLYNIGKTKKIKEIIFN